MEGSKWKVGVFGCGAMGSAITTRLLHVKETGGPVSQVFVWNRTFDKTAPLASKGATAIESFEEAVAQCDLVVLVVLDYNIAKNLIDSLPSDALKDRVVLQYTTGCATEARSFKELVATKGGSSYLDGAIADYPIGVAEGRALIHYSGSSELFEKFKPLFTFLGIPNFVGEDIGFANVVDEATLATLMPTLFGLLQGLAACEKDGFPKEKFFSIFEQTAPLLPALCKPLMTNIAAHNHTDKVNASLDTNIHAFKHLIEFSQGKGNNPTLLEAQLQILETAKKQAGTGAVDFSYVFETMLKKANE